MKNIATALIIASVFCCPDVLWTAEWETSENEANTLLYRLTISPVKDSSDIENIHFISPLEKDIARDAVAYYDYASIEYLRYERSKSWDFARKESYAKEIIECKTPEERGQVFWKTVYRSIPISTIWGDQKMWDSQNISPEETRKCLEELKPFFTQLEKATFSLRYDSDLDLRSEDDRAERLMQMRHFARILQVKAKLEIDDGKFDQARKSVTMLYRMANHLGENSRNMEALVGIALQGIGNALLCEYSEHPESPTIIWALQELPSLPCRPEVTCRKEYHDLISLYVPRLLKFKDADAVTNDEAARYLQSDEMFECHTIIFGGESPLDSDPPLSREQYEERIKKILKKLDPPARKKLLADGITQEKVDAMSAEKAVLVASVRGMEELQNTIYQLLASPYWLAQAKWDELETRESDTESDARIISTYYPTISSIGRAFHEAVTRTRFQHDLLFLAEAFRIYAGKHDGKLPDRMEQLKELQVPIPLFNPYTGEAYQWKKLDDRRLQIEGAGRWKYRYIITVRE